MKNKKRAARHRKNKSVIKRGITVALFMAALAWGVFNPKPVNAQLTHAQMLAITATYPDNLCKKEADAATVAANLQKGLDAINGDITAIKTKGTTTEAELKELNTKLATVVKQADIDASIKKSADEMQKQFDALSVLVNKNPSIGLVERKDIKIFHKDNLDEFKKLKKGGGTLNTTMKLTDLFSGSDKFKHLNKAAGNVSEGGNLGTGTTNIAIAPTMLAGVYAPPLRPNHIREVISTGTTDSNQIVFLQEIAATDGTGATAEGGTAGQSDFTMQTKTITVRKLNTYINISKEMMEDADFIDSEINTRFVPRLLMTEDTQLWSGSNASPNMDGLTTEASPVELPAKSADDPFTYFDVLHSAVNQGKVAYYKPSYIFIHPTDYNRMILAKDTYGRYQFPDVAILGRPLVINDAMVIQNTIVPIGQFLVGDFDMGAKLMFRNEIEVSFSTQNQDNFIKGFVTCLIEERLALVIYRPTAFIYGGFVTAQQSGS